MAIAAAARRCLWRGMGTAAFSGTDGTLLTRLVSEPESRVKATMEEAASSATHRDGAFWEPLAAALLRTSSPAKAHLILEWKLEKLLKEEIHDCEPYSRIIHFCGKTRNAALAMRVFECVEAQGIQLNTSIFNALLNAFLSDGDLLSAMTLYETMEGFVRLNMLDDAKTVFEEMISLGIKPTSAILEANLEMLSRKEEADRVRVFLKCASDGNWELNKAIFERLVRICLDGGEIDEMEDLLALIQKGTHLSSETQLHCGIIRFYAKADRLADMEHAICRMLDSGVMFMCPEDVEVIICSYFRHKEFDRLELFLNRIRGLFKLNKSTYDILVAGYRRFDLHERLDSIIADMREAGFA
ncbi:hypothetical protein U9M48_006187 [Paspalum notatum var. saurae]|uniref:Pentatricopeptide repeat-containing protein-mitochondrial domain-containing protein n=1 Tax=Paspalum notatum var. saurae TaxID=547442 RepID=A0AAQ3PRQ4_PASNO